MVSINGRELEEREKFIIEQLGSRGLLCAVEYKMDEEKISLKYHDRRFAPVLFSVLNDFERKYNMKADMEYEHPSDAFWREFRDGFWSGMAEMGS